MSSHHGAPDPRDDRPSLLMDDADRWPAVSGEPIRMLSALESTQRPKGRRWRADAPPAATSAPTARLWVRALTAALTLAIVATGGAYVWLLTHAERPPLAQASEPQRPEPLRTAQASAPTAAPASAAAQIESLPVATVTAAAPINPFDGLQAQATPGGRVAAPLPVTALSTAPASAMAAMPAPAGPFASLTAPGAGAPPAPTRAAPADAAPSAVPLKWSHALSSPTGTAAPTATATATADAALRPATTESDRPAVEAPRLSATERRRAQREADAALLAALVSHVNKHSRQEVNGEMAPLRLPGSAASPMTTIAQIVNHCRSLHGEEAKVCRVRICEHYWGKDDACSIKPTFAAHEPH